MNPTGPQNLTQTLLLLLLLIIVLALVFVGLAYVAYRHPALATPLVVATGGVLALLAVITFGIGQL